jgi:hypothetical protein
MSDIRSQGRKKSNFPAQTTVISGGSLDYFANGVNYKISFSDLVSQLGATGTISQVGAVTGTPVLETVGTTYKIRNIEDGSGIKSSLSPQNGVTLAHNFTFDTTGASLTDSPAVASPTLKSFVAGTGIQLVQAANTIQIDATGTTAPTSRIIINSEVDFPEQDATTITLKSNIIHEIGSSFSTAKRFIVEDGAVFTMGNQFGISLTYTGTGDMFTGVDVTFTIDTCRIDSPNANQTFNFSDTVGGTKIFFAKFLEITSTPKIGTCSAMLNFEIIDSNCLNCGDGISVAGTQTIFNVSKLALVSSSASFTAIDFGTSVVQNPEISDLIVIAPAGATGISGLASNGNVPTGFIGKLVDSSFSGGMTAELSGITSDDFRWSFSGNTGIPDTRPDALISINSNATETVISTINTPVKVTGTWAVEGDSHFTGDTTGRITYNGERDFTGPIDVSVTMLMASGSSKNVSAYIAINGTFEPKTVQKTSVSSSAADSVSIHWQHTFSTNDYIEVFVENNSDTVNIIGEDAVLRVN